MTCKCCFYHRRRRRPTKPRPIPLRARPRPKPINLRVVNEGMRRPRRHRLAGLHRPHPPPVIGPKLRGPVPFNFGISSPPFSFHNASLIYRMFYLAAVYLPNPVYPSAGHDKHHHLLPYAADKQSEKSLFVLMPAANPESTRGASGHRYRLTNTPGEGDPVFSQHPMSKSHSR